MFLFINSYYIITNLFEWWINADITEAIDVGIDEFGSCESPLPSPKSDKRLIDGQSVSEITYIHIHECDNFSVSGNMFMPLPHIFPFILLSCALVFR